MDPPEVARIPASDVLGVTVVMVQAWYKNKEFLRVGYYVKVQYADEKLRVSTCTPAARRTGDVATLVVRPARERQEHGSSRRGGAHGVTRSASSPCLVLNSSPLPCATSAGGGARAPGRRAAGCQSP